eukprot:gene27566-33292_t
MSIKQFNAPDNSVFEAVILVTRGDPLPKKNFETKLHPTYETSIRIKQSTLAVATTPHLVVKFFDQYRDLMQALAKIGVGYGLEHHVEAAFPKSYRTSNFGIKLSEDALQERCYMLNKWVQAVFVNYPNYPPAAQKLLSEFLSLDDKDEAHEVNKDKILAMLGKSVADANSPISAPTNSPAPAATEAAAAAPSAPLVKSLSASASVRSNSPAPSTAQRINSQRSMQRAGSVDSTITTTQYTGAELAEYSKENVLAPCLAVSVMRGDMMPKEDGESKLHHSYETIVRILPWEETSFPDKDALDGEAYAAHAKLPPIAVQRPFDGYRTLKLQLEELGLFTKDAAQAALKFNEDHSKRRHAISLVASFPRTLRRSSLGIGLTDAQLQIRVVQLNVWMGELLQRMPSYPAEIQTCILHFFSIHTPTEAEGLGEGVEVDAAAASSLQNEIFSAMLRGVYKPLPKPKSAEKGAGLEKRKSGLSLGLLKGLSEKGDGLAKKDDPVPVPKDEPVPPSVPAAINDVPAVPPAIPTPTPAAGSEHNSDNTTASHVLTPTMLVEYAKETFVHGYVGVCVKGGVRVKKKEGEAASHPGYETVLRALPAKELPPNILEALDSQAYNTLTQTCLVSVAKAFDAYRSLHDDLQKHGVYSMDKKDKGARVCVVEARFPRTYRRSSWGIKMTDAQLLQRQVLLNRYMGALLSKFQTYPREAQELIKDFLMLDEDNPAEPHNKIIVSITFVPPSKPAPAAASSAASSSNQNNSSAANKRNMEGSYTYGGKGVYRAGQPVPIDDSRSAERVGGGVGCGPGQMCVIS